VTVCTLATHGDEKFEERKKERKSNTQHIEDSCTEADISKSRNRLRSLFEYVGHIYKKN
jgi:hypothetical protein